MGSRLTAVDAITRIRRRIQDEGATAWTDAELLEAMDNVLQELHEDMRMAGRDWSVVKKTIAIADLTNEGSLLFTYRLPENVKAVRRIEGVISGEAAPVAIDHVNLDQRDIGRRHYAYPVWTFDDGTAEGTIAFAGRVDSYSSLTLYYVARFAELHHGSSPGGGLQQITLDTSSTTRTGPLINRTDVYVGMEVVWTSGALEGEMGRIVAYDPSTASATVDSDWSALPGAATYSLVVPLPPEHTNYLIEKVAHHMFLRAGNVEWLQAASGFLAHLETKFHESLEHRVQNTPKRFHSSRIGG